MVCSPELRVKRGARVGVPGHTHLRTCDLTFQLPCWTLYVHGATQKSRKPASEQTPAKRVRESPASDTTCSWSATAESASARGSLGDHADEHQQHRAGPPSSVPRSGIPSCSCARRAPHAASPAY